MKLNDLFTHIAHCATSSGDREFKYELLRFILENREDIGIENDVMELNNNFDKIVTKLSEYYPAPDVSQNVKELFGYSLVNIDDESEDEDIDANDCCSDDNDADIEYEPLQSHDEEEDEDDVDDNDEDDVETESECCKHEEHECQREYVVKVYHDPITFVMLLINFVFTFAVSFRLLSIS